MVSARYLLVREWWYVCGTRLFSVLVTDIGADVGFGEVVLAGPCVAFVAVVVFYGLYVGSVYPFFGFVGRVFSDAFLGSLACVFGRY